MKYLFLFGLLFQLTAANAEGNLNHVSCVYKKTKIGWEKLVYNYYKSGFFLEKGEHKRLSGLQTINVGGNEPNFAYCSVLVGLGSNNSFLHEAYSFSSRYFTSDLGYNGLCTIEGEGLQTTKKELPLKRGEVIQFQVPWFPQPALIVKVYLPLVSELDNMQEVTEKKCTQLKP